MLISITAISPTSDHKASDIGYLFHKNPARFQSFPLSFGQAHVAYTKAEDDECTIFLALDVDTIQMAKGKKRQMDAALARYVNDRPYVVSSFMSTAISQVFGSALAGTCKQRPELVDQQYDFDVSIEVLPIKGGQELDRRLFEPLGYQVEAEAIVFDPEFPEWGDSFYYSVRLKNKLTVRELLNHLYVLIPVFDHHKHYFIGPDELDKLLAKGEGWLAEHPERELISRRYLKFQPGLARQAVERLTEAEEISRDLNVADGSEGDKPSLSPSLCEGRAPARGELSTSTQEKETTLHLNDQRLASVVETLQGLGARRVIDLGCGEGKLLQRLLKDRQFLEIVGMDVTVRSLEIASRRLKLDQLPRLQAERIKLLHGSLMYRDKRFAGFDAATMIEVIEHLDPPSLLAFERVVFEYAKPESVVLTTPNHEYNVVWDSLPAGKFRHPDHRFEWSRDEFQSWASSIGERFAYTVEFKTVGPVHNQHGSPTQMAIFTKQTEQGTATKGATP